MNVRRRAVLVGVGTVVQKAPPGEGDDAIGLMVRAARAAGDDAGAPELLRRVGRVLVPQGTWQARDPARAVARGVGAHAARTVFVQLGIPQQTLIDQALAAIAAGEIDAALVVGGEAKARDDAARRAGLTLPPLADSGSDPDDLQMPVAEILAAPELAHGFVVPAQQYAAIDNALRAAEGVTIAEHCREIDALWSRFDAIATSNPEAAFAGGRSPDRLRSPADGNRWLAFPYRKWHATQWGVDQAGALLLCAEALADEFGIPAERRLHPLVSLESSHSVSLTSRAELHRWPAMRELGRAAQAHLRRPLAELEYVELYSCFPAAVRVQQRELDLALDGTPTLTGGMAFAGGPFNNFVLQATAAMARRLRADAGACGLVTTVSGLLTKPGLAVWSTDPGEQPPLLADLHDSARAATALRPVLDAYAGPITIASYTVRPDPTGDPAQLVVIGDTPAGARCVGVLDDPDLAGRALVEEMIGRQVELGERV